MDPLLTDLDLTTADENERALRAMRGRERAERAEAQEKAKRLERMLEQRTADLEREQKERARHQEEARRKDPIIAALTERIPELEPPREARNGDLAASAGRSNEHVPPNRENPTDHSW